MFPDENRKKGVVVVQTCDRDFQMLYEILFFSMREGAALHRLVFDKNGRAINYVILDVNPQFEAILDLSREQVINQLATEVYGTPEAPYLLEYIKATQQKEPLYFEIFFPPLKKHFAITAVRHKSNEFFTIFTDLSDKKKIEHEREKLQEQFLQAQKMEAIGRLASGVAHDFNNLLMAIMGYCELSITHLGSDHPIAKNITEIQRAGDRATALTRQLLTFSRQQIVEPKILNLNHILRNMEKMLQRLIGEDIEYTTHLDETLGSIQADAGQIEQVIMNLVVNARDAMPSGGKLTLETQNIELNENFSRKHVDLQPGNYILLAMSDTGIGMEEEIQNHIFEPFFTTKEKGKGTGLGLSTVHGIMKQSNGQISVYSAPGQGTTFKLYFPRMDASPAQSFLPEAASYSLRGTETILLVEDEEFVRKIIHRILNLQGYNVLQAENGDRARQLADSFPDKIHLLLTDVIMPQLSGQELSKQLTLSRPGIKVLFMSGYTDAAIVHHGILDEKVHFIQKPFTTELFLQKIRELLDANPQ